MPETQKQGRVGTGVPAMVGYSNGAPTTAPSLPAHCAELQHSHLQLLNPAEILMSLSMQPFPIQLFCLG